MSDHTLKRPRARTAATAACGAAFLAIPLALAGVPAAQAAASAPGTAGNPYVLTVGAQHAQYTTIQAAVDAVPDDSAAYYEISISPGSYAESVTVSAAKLHLSMIGADHDPRDVVITAANYNQEPNGSGGTLGTEGSATVHVKANDFTAEYITFANTFDKLDHPTVTGTQAVALAMEGDRQVYEHDVFSGHQDTLLSWDSTATRALRQYVYDSTIEGDVDFIFGDGSLVVDRCDVVTVNDGVYQKAYLTAPATFAGNPYGELITGSTVSSTLAPNAVYLGRAWEPTTAAVPQLVVRDTDLPAQVDTSDPYLGISGATWTPGRYGEYQNTGFGAYDSSLAGTTDLVDGTAPSNPDRPQLTDAQAAGLTAQRYLAGSDGWDPVVPAGHDPTAASLAAAADARLGDTRPIRQPATPTVCQTVTSVLAAPANRLFTDAQEAAAPDTARIQAALNACVNTGGSVLLTGSGPNPAFLSAPLTVGNDEYLVLAPDATLFASRQASDYQEAGSAEAACGSIAATGNGCTAFITVTGSHSGIESTRAGGREGVIDGRGDLPILGTDTSWWANAVTAKAEALKQVNPRLIQATGADDMTVYDITLTSAPKEHLYYKSGGGLLVWGLTINTDDQSLNTDGVDFDSSAYGTVVDSRITDGDDCIAMQTNSATDAHITFADDACYGTHGISIGSETTYGLEDILVRDDTVDGLDAAGRESTIPAGIRIKSYAGAGGEVTDALYQDVRMSNLLNPIDIDPFYDPATGTTYPYFTGVVIEDATATRSLPGAESVLDGYLPQLPLGLTLRDVWFDTTASTAQDAVITEQGSDIAIHGPDVTVKR